MRSNFQTSCAEVCASSGFCDCAAGCVAALQVCDVVSLAGEVGPLRRLPRFGAGAVSLCRVAALAVQYVIDGVNAVM